MASFFHVCLLFKNRGQLTIFNNLLVSLRSVSFTFAKVAILEKKGSIFHHVLAPEGVQALGDQSLSSVYSSQHLRWAS